MQRSTKHCITIIQGVAIEQGIGETLYETSGGIEQWQYTVLAPETFAIQKKITLLAFFPVPLTHTQPPSPLIPP